MASLGEVEAILVTAVITAILAVWAIITQRVVSRRVATLEYIARVESDEDLIKARNEFIALTSDDDNILKFADPSKFTSDEAHSIRLVLNEREQLAVGIQFGVLDKHYIRRYSRGIILKDFRLAAPFIYKLRALYDNPAIYHEFEDLARSLEANKMPSRWYWTRLWF